jgi:hypothetical protein
MMPAIRLCLWLLALSCVASGRADEGTPGTPRPIHRVGAPGEFPADGRLHPKRTLRDAYHPWAPPRTLAEWEAERERIRTQLLVACGLWPLPEKTPLEPVIHGLVDREDYTVERVFFASRPGVYVTGSLYRPKGFAGPRPAVLNPHGHWANGRFYDAGAEAAAKQIETGAEMLTNPARYPLQARMVQLARMGCVVFHYDMIGYADNGPLEHSAGFSDAEAELRSQNIMGLQTWNSIRALDFVAALPDVDPTRIGVTGASGGGTQTFMLGAIDPRPAVAFPAVMVSTNMQGGCVCENASLLRLGINNVAIAACFAPKPLGMTGADDWTIDIETKGLPELKHVWTLLGQPDLVEAKCFPQFGHNYNRVSRLQMYAWMNRHLKLGATEPIDERDFQPLSVEEMTVFTAEHPRPGDALPAAALRPRLTDESQLWYADLVERGAKDREAYRSLIEPVADVLFGGPAPDADEITSETLDAVETDWGTVTRGWCGRRSSTEHLPWLLLTPKKLNGEVTVWIDGRGKHALFDAEGRPVAAVRKLLDKGQAVLAADVFLTGEFLAVEAETGLPVNRQFAGYTYGYNRPLMAERIRDVLTVTGFARTRPDVKQVHLLGTRAAGPWVLLARGRLGESIGQTQVELGEFSFGGLASPGDPNFLPAALKFGGLGGLLALAGPVTVEVAGAGDATREELAPFTALGGTVKYINQRLSPVSDD